MYVLSPVFICYILITTTSFSMELDHTFFFFFFFKTLDFPLKTWMKYLSFLVMSQRRPWQVDCREALTVLSNTKNMGTRHKIFVQIYRTLVGVWWLDHCPLQSVHNCSDANWCEWKSRKQIAQEGEVLMQKLTQLGCKSDQLLLTHGCPKNMTGMFSIRRCRFACAPSEDLICRWNRLTNPFAAGWQVVFLACLLPSHLVRVHTFQNADYRPLSVVKINEAPNIATYLETKALARIFNTVRYGNCFQPPSKMVNACE